MSKKIKISFIVSGVGLFLLLGLLLVEMTHQSTSQPVRQAGAVNIGGPFELINTKGAPVTEADFAGQPMLVFFGFTYCPDVCPTSLDRLGAALELLKAQHAEIYDALQPVFISVDPARDTAAQMAEYLAYFHPKIIGLTGSEAQIKKVKAAYRVYAARAKETDANGHYNVDHSSLFYLMDGENRYLAHFDHGITPEKLAENLAEKLAQ